MSVVGSPAGWADFLGSMVPDILHLIAATWEQMPPPPADAKEDDVTKDLCLALRTSRTARQLMFRIDTQYVELEPLEGTEAGRLDIAFSPLVPDERIYFCLEGKRLNVLKDGQRRSYASEYVKFGMRRFVTGQYPKLVKHGGMIGYVFDGDIAGAIGNVQSNITALCDELLMTRPGALVDSSILISDHRARESHHQRPHEKGSFCIHHMFVATN